MRISVEVFNMTGGYIMQQKSAIFQFNSYNVFVLEVQSWLFIMHHMYVFFFVGH